MKIRVKVKHIKAGVPNDVCYCPVALALNEQTDRTWFVAYNFAYLIKDNEIKQKGKIALPHKICEWIREFDNHEYMEPTEFYIRR